jgi:glycerol-3-phosphate dehydrogenase
MGLPKNKLSLTRKDVESGKVGKYTDEEYQLYARHDKPEELLESDSKYAQGHNPVVGRESPVNK